MRLAERLEELEELDGDWLHWLQLADKAQPPLEVKRNGLASSGQRQTQPSPQASYEGLQGKWLDWLEVANRFENKAKAEDRHDLRHTIVLAFASQQARNERLGKPDLSFYGQLRIASHCVADYWRQEKRNARLTNLNMLIADDEGNSVELLDTLADDSINLEAWLEASTWELGYPRRLTEIAHKLDNGEKLTPTDSQYLWRYRKRTQKRLL